VNGLLSIAFGVFASLYTSEGALALLYYIGGFSIISGFLNLFLAHKLRMLNKTSLGAGAS